MDAIGIKIEFKTAKWPENLKASRAGKLMMWGVGWSAGAPDGDTFLALGYGPNKGGANHARFNLPAFNALYESSAMLPDGPERQAVMDEAKKLMVAYMPYKVHVHRIFTDLAHPWVQGYHRNIFVREFFKYVDVDPAERLRQGVQAAPLKRPLCTSMKRRDTLALGAALALPPAWPAAAGASTARRRPQGAARTCSRWPRRASTRRASATPTRHRHGPHLRSAVRYDHLARPVKLRAARPTACPRQRRLPRVDLAVKPGIFFADDPAFKGAKRELVAADYLVYTSSALPTRPTSRRCGPASRTGAFPAWPNPAQEGAGRARSPSTTTRRSKACAALDRYTLQLHAGRAAPALHREHGRERPLAPWRARWSVLRRQDRRTPGGHRAPSGWRSGGVLR
jgi:hypothetical protein